MSYTMFSFKEYLHECEEVVVVVEACRDYKIKRDSKKL
jgi:hypothetical protein